MDLGDALAHNSRERAVVEGMDGKMCTAAAVLKRGVLHPQVTVSLDPIVGDGRERRNHDAWFPLSGRHCDGLQVREARMEGV